QGQRAERRAAPAPVSDRRQRPDGHRVRHQPGGVPRRLRGRPAARAHRGHGRDPAAGLGAGVLGGVGATGLEVAALVDRARHARSRGGQRPGPLDGRACRGDDHRGRGLARDHDLQARRGHRGDRDRRGGGRPSRGRRAELAMTDSTTDDGVREGYAEVGEGVRLHYVEAGEGPLVVLLHGFPEFWYGWRRQIAPLANAGYRVVAPDLRGYNLSSVLDEYEDYTADKLAADIRGLILERGAESALVAGHDWGGTAAWTL